MIRFLAGLITVIVVSFIGLVVAASILLPGYVKSSRKSRDELNNLNSLANNLQEAQSDLNVFKRNRTLLKSKVPSVDGAIALLNSLAASNQVTLTLFPVDPAAASKPETSINGTLSSASTAAVSQFLASLENSGQLISLKKLVIKSDNIVTGPVTADIQLILPNL